MLRKPLKAKARQLLEGIWGRAIALLFYLVLILLFFSVLEQMIASFLRIQSLEQLLMPLFIYGKVTVYLSELYQSALLWFGTLILTLTGIFPFLQGMYAWYYARSSGEIWAVSSAFHWFTAWSRFFHSLRCYYLLFFKRLLWSILFSLPALGLYFVYVFSVVYRVDTWISFILFFLCVGLELLGLLFSWIVCYRYFLVVYIMCDDPTVRVRTAFKNSVYIMKHKKFELFALDVSFLPYYLLNVLLIPCLWTFPYIQMTKALYAKKYIMDYKNEFMQNTLNFKVD